MRIIRTSVTLSIFILLALMTTSVAGQDMKSLVATASGQGTIKLGKEEFKINAVVVKLFEDGKAEINLVTDISIFINGTWSRKSETDKSIDLKITGGSVSGNVDGGGKLTITDDRKIAALHLQLQNNSTKKLIKVDFVANKNP